MNIKFTIDIRTVQRIACTMLAALLLTMGLPLLGTGAQALQMSDRSIQMSDSSVSDGGSGVGSGEGVTYQVSFTTSASASSMVIDFCANDPIINDTCAAPTGMSVTSAALATVTGGGNITSAGWTISTSNSPNPQIKLALGTGSAAAAGAQVFDITGIQNPSSADCSGGGTTACSFYARMYTWSTTNYGGSNSNPGGTGGTGGYNQADNVGNNYVDYGGVALTTTTAISITARVQETISFCVTSEDADDWANTTPNNSSGAAGDCSAGEVSANPPAITLGHGTPTKVLDSNNVDIANVWTQLSTNATHGAVINMHNNFASCGGLSTSTTGSPCNIPATNGGAAAPAALAAGTAAFGLFVAPYGPSTANGCIGTMNPTPTYNAYVYSGGAYSDSACVYTPSGGTNNNVSAPSDTGNAPSPSAVWFGMDNTSSNAASSFIPSAYSGAVSGTSNSSYGSTIAESTSPVYHADDRLMFAATAALTTPAGIYQTNLSLIATGTF